MFSKNDGIVFSFANRKEFKYQSFDMCLALWPAHYRYIRVFSFTASCFKFAKKVLPQLKFKLLKLDLLPLLLSVPPQYHTTTTVYCDYLHFARNMYAEKNIVSEYVVALLVIS